MKEKKDNNNEKNSKEDLSLTRQQKFNFYKNTIYDEEDKERKKNKSRTRSLKVELLKVIKQRNKYKKLLFLFVGLFIVVSLLSGMYIILYNNSKDSEKSQNVKEAVKKPVVFLGDSITDYYDIRRFFKDDSLINSGFSGYKTTDILSHIDKMVYQFNPKKVFLLIGINDVPSEFNISADNIFENIKKIIELIEQNTTNCKIYVESIYPINNTDNEKISQQVVNSRSNMKVKEINKKIDEYARNKKITYIDLYSKLIDEDGNLKLEYTKEGLHISEEGYKVITEKLKKYM